VISSPNFDRRAPPQQGQAVGPGTITRSRGKCSGKGLRAGRCRVKAATLVVFADARSAANSSAVAEASSSSSCSSSWSSSRELRSERRPNRSRRSFSGAPPGLLPARTPSRLHLLKSTWDFDCWLAHTKSSSWHDAETACSTTENAVNLWVSILIRHIRKVPEARPACGSRREASL
jgi:hypothetical protein